MRQFDKTLNCRPDSSLPQEILEIKSEKILAANCSLFSGD